MDELANFLFLKKLVKLIIILFYLFDSRRITASG